MLKVHFGHEPAYEGERPWMALTMLPSGRQFEEFEMVKAGCTWGIPASIVHQVVDGLGVRGDIDRHLWFEGHRRDDGVLATTVSVA